MGYLYRPLKHIFFSHANQCYNGLPINYKQCNVGWDMHFFFFCIPKLHIYI